MILCADLKDVLLRVTDIRTARSFTKHWIEKTEKAMFCTFAI